MCAIDPVPPSNPMQMDLEEEIRRMKERDEGKEPPDEIKFWGGFVIIAMGILGLLIGMTAQ